MLPRSSGRESSNEVYRSRVALVGKHVEVGSAATTQRLDKQLCQRHRVGGAEVYHQSFPTRGRLLPSSNNLDGERKIDG